MAQTLALKDSHNNVFLAWIISLITHLLSWLPHHGLLDAAYVRGLPLVGMLPVMLRGRFYETVLYRLFDAAKDDGISYSYMGTMPLVYLRDPAIIRQVYVEAADKTTRRDSNGNGPWAVNHRMLGPTLVSTSNEAHQRLFQRGFLRTFNNMSSLQSLYPDMIRITQRYIEKMKANSAQNNDLFKFCQMYALDVAWVAVLGIDNASESFDLVAASYDKYGEVVGGTPHITRHNLQACVRGRSLNDPDSIEAGVQNDFSDCIRHLIEQNPMNIDPSKEAMKNRRQNLLQHAAQHSQEMSNAGIPEEVMLQARQSLSLAHFLSSIALTWGIYELGRRPDIVTKLRQELRDAGWDHNDQDVHKLNKLKYLDSIVNEILRDYPPAVVTPRLVTSPITTQTSTNKTVVIPEGAMFFISIISLHHDPKVWGNDAGEFRPERWEGLHANTLESRCHFFPFTAGARKCPSTGYVYVQLKLALAMIFTQLEVDILDTTTVNSEGPVAVPLAPIRFRVSEAVVV